MYMLLLGAVVIVISKVHERLTLSSPHPDAISLLKLSCIAQIPLYSVVVLMLQPGYTTHWVYSLIPWPGTVGQQACPYSTTHLTYNTMYN